MQMKIACSTLVYRKMLRVSTGAANKIPVGQMVNMFSNDIGYFESCSFYLCYAWIAPIQGIIAMGILIRELGPSCLPGFSLVILLFSVQSLIGKGFSKLRLAIAKRTDKRVRLMLEVISSIRAIKMFTWEKLFIDILEAARKYELKEIKRKSVLQSVNASIFNTLSRLIIFLCLVTYAMLGFPFQAEKVYLTVALINSVQNSLTVYFPMAMIGVAEVYMSCLRLQSKLEMEEKDVTGFIQHIEPHSKQKACGLTVYEVTARWNRVAKENIISNVSCSVKAGDLLAIVGLVGSGKTSFLNVILGELPAHIGRVFVQGKISYASQEPWVFSGTVRKNIVFCLPFNEKKYLEVIKVCALEQDLKELPNGDFSLVGEHGTALSGGQKARVSLARAIYNDADIYLLDDPLSAVDTCVGHHIFDQCIMKYLRDKVRILVTHQIQYLKEASKILILREGHTHAYGAYTQLVNGGIDIRSLIKKKENTSTLSEGVAKFKQGNDCIESQKIITNSAEQKQNLTTPMTNGIHHEGSKQIDDSNKEIKYDEEARISGSVKATSFIGYFKAGFGWPFLIFFLPMNSIVLIIILGSDYFLSYWTNKEQLIAESVMNMSNAVEETNSSFINVSSSDDLLDRTLNIYIYSGLVVGMFIGVFLKSFFFFWACIASSQGLHKNTLWAVFRCPMKYFDFRPAGQILNRFSKDLNVIDEKLPKDLLDSLNIVLSVVGLLALVASTNVWLLVPAVLVLVLLVAIRCIYLPILCDLKRMESVAYSPVLTHLSVSLQGLITVRAFESQNFLMNQFDELQNFHTSVSFVLLALEKGFIFYLDAISAIYICFVSLSFMASQNILVGNLGLAISSAMSLSGVLFWGIYQTTQVQNELVSVERLLDYCDLEPEAQWEIEGKTPNTEWPEHGIISYENVSLQYSECEAPVLKNLTFCIKGSEKVGIVGRTGAGKSSLVSSLFRLIESSGDIRIDSHNTKELGLHDIRGRLSIIPQNPVLFSTSVRINLDPYKQASDEKLWTILEEVHMKNIVHQMNGGLDACLAEGGTNLSVGQRQLLCLARAILKHSKILVLDEASANIDLRTDELIQELIRTKFHDCTVLTIAHRLQTIVDSDRVMVLQAGNLKEFDEPHILLQNKNSLFFNMVQQTGQNTSRQLQQIAEYVYLQKQASLGKL
ncbi:ATP-binding cassette sub-family C member 4-like isoform X2 [Portunus trituberculatus]|nr:ATP-binding cassette sub-family C member 4-like isoform X2 [Portunus trituberculatus]XP_045130926.1 ATP-binding cassette sub-family C member 4-like isoform X2 [Portunus trituberculatus]XP_045130927.1 ATP-binding cassette sub-family C member 4-like isoform X2 [Portunus trituberculatus]